MASRSDSFPETICRPISCRNSAPANRSARKFSVSGWAIVPSKSLNTASGLVAPEFDSLEKGMNCLILLVGTANARNKARRASHFLATGSVMQHDERTCLGAQQETRGLETIEQQCFTTL